VRPRQNYNTSLLINKRINIIKLWKKKIFIAPYLYLGRQFHLFPVVGFWRTFDILIRTHLIVENRWKSLSCNFAQVLRLIN